MRPTFILFALVGHAFLWIGVANRLHALGVRRCVVNLATASSFLCATLIPVGIGWCTRHSFSMGAPGSGSSLCT